MKNTVLLKLRLAEDKDGQLDRQFFVLKISTSISTSIATPLKWQIPF